MTTIQEINEKGTELSGDERRGRRLRILEAGSAFSGWGGTEIHVLNLAEQLQKRGHTVHVTCRPEQFVEREAKNRGLHTIAATCRRQNAWLPIFRYLSILRKGKYDVVHVHWDNDYRVPATAARICGVPVVLLSHHSPHPIKKPFNRWFYRTVLYSRFIALSDSVKRLLLDQGISPENVTTIHHGIDVTAIQKINTSSQDVRQGWGIPEGAVVVGMAGRLGQEKGVFTFANALALIQDDNIYGVFVGDGKLEMQLKERLRELKIEHRVVFAGFRSDVGNAINALDIHVLPSVWAEPCAAVVEQAMALGKPVIGTSTGGTPELIDDGTTGILVPPGDEQALADAIAKLGYDLELRTRMGNAGRARAALYFTQDRMVDTIEDVYYAELERSVRKSS